MAANIIDKIQKLLALAGNNPEANEAKEALLKAQELMAQYNVDMEGLQQEASIKYLLVETKVKAHKLNNALTKIIAESFACKHIIVGNRLSIFGREDNAKAAASALEFAHKVMVKGGNKATKDAGFTPGRTGAAHWYNSYCFGFLKGLNDAMAAQTVALAVVIPEDVKTEFDTRFSNHCAYKSTGLKAACGVSAFEAGRRDGATVMNKRSLGA